MNDDFDRSRYVRQRSTRSAAGAVPNTASQAGQAAAASRAATGQASSASSSTSSSSAPKKQRSARRRAGLMDIRRHWWKYVLGLAAAGLLIFLVINYLSTRNQLESLKNNKSAGDSSEQQLLNEIGGYMVLPTDETPTTATVNDASKLKDQVFFLNAKDGDKVIIYAKAKRAILYRPSEKKIVEYSPINLGNNSQP